MNEENFLRQRIRPDRLPSAVVAKWSETTLKEGFVPFPKRLLRCLPTVFTGPKVAEDLAVILAIVDYKRPNLSRLPSLEYLAFIAGMQPKNFQERLVDLEKRKLITVAGDEDEMRIDLMGVLSAIEKNTED